MELGLAGKIAIVTGGSKGIGRVTALALAQEGAQVAICARGLDDLQETAKEIEAATGQSVFVVQSDMTRPEDIQELVSTTASTSPPTKLTPVSPLSGSSRSCR